MQDLILNIIGLGGGILFIFVLMITINKMTSRGYSYVRKNAYMTIIEKLPVGKDSFLLLVKVGDEGLVILQSLSYSKVIKTLNATELNTAGVLGKGTNKNEDVSISNLKAIPLNRLRDEVVKRESGLNLRGTVFLSKVLNRKKV